MWYTWRDRNITWNIQTDIVVLSWLILIEADSSVSLVK